MLLPLPQKLDRTEALRYLGVQAGGLDAATAELLDACEAKLLHSMKPRAVWLETTANLMVDSACGSDLKKHLNGCEHILLMAVTLGPQTDALLRQAAASDIAAAAVTDALASAAIEQVCDALENDLRRDYGSREKYLTGRYSPGYGDCPLKLQKKLCGLLDTGRKIGLSVTESYLMTPRKSVTAVLGISARPVTGYRAGCGHCVLRETCLYRKRGEICES